MDKNQATGLILIAIMLISYFTFFAPESTLTEQESVEEVTTPNKSTKLNIKLLMTPS